MLINSSIKYGLFFFSIDHTTEERLQPSFLLVKKHLIMIDLILNTHTIFCKEEPLQFQQIILEYYISANYFLSIEIYFQ